MQYVVVLYTIFFLVGPRRIVRSIQEWQGIMARLQGRPPPPSRATGLLHTIEMLEYAAPIGWTLAVLGFAAFQAQRSGVVSVDRLMAAISPASAPAVAAAPVPAPPPPVAPAPSPDPTPAATPAPSLCRGSRGWRGGS